MNHYFNKTILIDIDDTIENLCEVWCQLLNERYGTNVSYTDVDDWDISSFFPTLTDEQVFGPLHEEEIWYRIRPLDGAVEHLRALMRDGFRVFLCTTTDYRNIRPKFEAIIQRYFPFISWKQVIVTSRKQMIRADILIDDGIHNLEGGSYQKILMTAPHNRSYNAEANGMHRVYNWEEAYRLVKQLCGGE